MKVWIAHRLRNKLISEADRTFPSETGGVLAGYWVKDEAVISDATGPGPNAIHRADWFAPDCSFHETEIAKIYEASGRKWTYLGDWHSHPLQITPTLSSQDQKTLRRIAHSRNARASTPLMLILSGQPQEWKFAVWQWQSRFSWPRRPKTILLDLVVH